LEEVDPELGELLKGVVKHNSEVKPSERIVVDFERELVYKKTLTNTNKIGRNDPCGCGSGKKFKKCCGA
jgi:uncharacterized protein YecA (UPF0149 family)